MAIESINAVTLAVSDMERSVDFYISLGFEIEYGGRRDPFTTFRIETQALNLQLTQRDRIVAGWGRFIVYVDNVDDLYEMAVTAGHDVEATPADAPWGERFFHVNDPDGHQISFARPL